MTDHDDDRTHLLDLSAGIDVGQGFTLLWSIAPDGGQWPVLADQRQTEPQFVPHERNHFRELAPHELPGRLPEAFRQFRCGAPTRSGKPCQTTVAGPVARCRHHEQAPTSKPAPPAAVDAELALFDLETGDER